MQIVINIDENVYTRLFDNGIQDNEIAVDDVCEMARSIRKGTPLQKGHGRIADMDAAIKCIEEVTGDDAVYAISLIEWACGKRTIIEADKAESEGKE